MKGKVYYQDGYLRELEVEVAAIEGNKVFFDRTIFYPEGGGQPGDRGLFNSYRILDTRKEGERVCHLFESVEGLCIGDKGVLSLDWDHRYKYMKEHSAQHLLSSLLFHELGAGTVAVHLGEEAVTIELGDGMRLDEGDILKIEDKANECIRRGLGITQRLVSRKEAEALHLRRSIKVDDDEVLLVFIDQEDVVACGGVHVASTREIGEIAYLKRESIRGHERLFFLVGDEAVRVRRENARILKEVSTMLSAPNCDISQVLERKLEGLEELKREVRRLSERLAEKELESLSGTFLETMLSLEDFQAPLERSGKKNVFILKTGERSEFLFYGDKEVFQEIRTRIDIKGGGRPPLFRGMVLSSLEEVEEFFK